MLFIRRCRDLGFNVEQVRALLCVVEAKEPSCLAARDLALTHLDAVRAKRAELVALEQTLLRLVSTCTPACAPQKTETCTILEDLGCER